MMSLTATRGLSARFRPRKVRGSIFSALPRTQSTSGMSAKRCGSTCAAQPVTIRRAAGFSRLSLRMVWPAWRTASAVTAQVLTITVSCSPAAAAWRRITSDSKALSRQPSVTTRTPPPPCGEGLGVGNGLYVGSSVSEDPTPPSATCACVGSSLRSTEPTDDCWLIAKIKPSPGRRARPRAPARPARSSRCDRRRATRCRAARRAA